MDCYALLCYYIVKPVYWYDGFTLVVSQYDVVAQACVF